MSQVGGTDGWPSTTEPGLQAGSQHATVVSSGSTSPCQGDSASSNLVGRSHALLAQFGRGAGFRNQRFPVRARSGVLHGGRTRQGLGLAANECALRRDVRVVRSPLWRIRLVWPMALTWKVSWA